MLLVAIPRSHLQPIRRARDKHIKHRHEKHADEQPREQAADADGIGEDVAGYTAVTVAAVQPDAVGMPHVPYHVAPEEHVLRAMKLGPRRLPLAFRVGPAAPLNQVVLDQNIARPHASDAFHAAIAHRVAANDMGSRGLLSAKPAAADLDRKSVV